MTKARTANKSFAVVGETAKFDSCAPIELLFKIEDLCFDCPTIAKPRNFMDNLKYLQPWEIST